VRAGPGWCSSPGASPSDENGKTVGGATSFAQTRQVHENIKRWSRRAGGTFADVCKVTVFLKDVATREGQHRAQGEYFGRTGREHLRSDLAPRARTTS